MQCSAAAQATCKKQAVYDYMWLTVNIASPESGTTSDITFADFITNYNGNIQPQGNQSGTNSKKTMGMQSVSVTQ